MFLLLIATSAVYFALGDLTEALVLAASMVAILVITVAQERRTERTLEALRDLSSPRALVLRDGEPTRIAGSAVVRGDLLMLGEGDRIAADARIADSHDLLVDESLLTGESVPVAKRASERDEGAVFSGTLIVKGSARAEVVATGTRSQLGRIGASLEIETARIVRLIAVFALIVSAAVALLYFAMRGDALAGILAGLTLAMALLPEEFPVVLTVFLAVGAWRIARQGVLTRRLPAIEMLGAATVLCCDKTGTLTENRMRVVETWVGGSWRAPDPSDGMVAPLLAAAARACESDPFDPMERAILEAARGVAAPTEGPIERRYPLAEGFLAVCHGWRLPSGEARLAMKGAPETVLALCALPAAQRTGALQAAEAAAARGLRLLAVAEASAGRGDWLEKPAGYAWRFLGFVALADPLRSAVPAAIAVCRRAGIRVVMITGDHPATAQAIARGAGIEAAKVLTGAQLEVLDAKELAAAVRDVQVFARVRPEQKLRLVNALRAAGEVVAMTGDGVNDAPALKAAHIGIAMGRRGTDVAREAASLVLLEDDFTAIVGTVRLGRRIYDNIRNAMRYLVAVHVPLAGMSFVPLAAGWPLFLFPVHVVFLEFVIDPACSIVFEAERSDPHVMERAPRPSAQRLFTPAGFAVGLALGASLLAAVALVYGWALYAGRDNEAARAMAFSALVAGNLGLIFANRSHELTVLEMATRENAALWWIVGGTLAALGATLYVPAIAHVFRFAPLAPGELVAGAACGFVSVGWYDLRKILQRRRPRYR
jgi:Ca2+-transporting ATPase